MQLTDSRRGHLAMLAFSALVAGSFSLGALAAPHVDPAALSALRFLLAGLLVGVAALATTGLPRSAWVAPWRYLVLGGLLAAYFVLMFEGLKTAQPVSAAAVFTLTPVMAAGFGWLLLRQRLTGRMALALVIGAVGALWVIFRADLAALLALADRAGRGDLFLGLRRPCALRPHGPQAEPGRACGGLHLRDDGGGHRASDPLGLARDPGNGLGGPAWQSSG